MVTCSNLYHLPFELRNSSGLVLDVREPFSVGFFKEDSIIIFCERVPGGYLLDPTIFKLFAKECPSPDDKLRYCNCEVGKCEGKDQNVCAFVHAKPKSSNPEIPVQHNPDRPGKYICEFSDGKTQYLYWTGSVWMASTTSGPVVDVVKWEFIPDHLASSLPLPLCHKEVSGGGIAYMCATTCAGLPNCSNKLPIGGTSTIKLANQTANRVSMVCEKCGVKINHEEEWQYHDAGMCAGKSIKP